MLRLIHPKQTIVARTCILFISGAFSFPAFSNPVLDHVTSGNVNVQQIGGITKVQQTSDKAIINWQSFNIGANEAAHFQQPVDGVALNRISPQQGASQIYGALTATGKIVLVNQAGIYFGPTARVDVGSIMASTSDMSDQNFLSSHYIFDHPSASGAIINAGTIIAAQHGLVALLGTGVSNTGTIQADLGNVVLASGSKFTVDLSGDQLINFAVDDATLTPGVDYQGNHLKDAVKNSGEIIANGGTVLLTAKTASQMLDHTINMTGVIEAKSVEQHKGEIILAGGDQGIVNVTGALHVSGEKDQEHGGTVKITGHNILLDKSAIINAYGSQGGGDIYIGGGRGGSLLTLFNGQTILPTNTVATVIAPNASLNADAVFTGQGGNIIVWSNDTTKAYGNLSARGGSIEGNGGFIETSGHSLSVNHIIIHTDATKGLAGRWLLDPYDVSISNTETSNGTFNSADPNIFTPSSSGSNISAEELAYNLNYSDVTITTSGAGSEKGDININSGFNFPSTGRTLTMNANGSIIVNPNATINILANTLILNAPQGDITIAYTGNIQGNTGGFGLNQGTLQLNAGHAVNVNGGIGGIANGEGLSSFNPILSLTVNAPITVFSSTGRIAERNAVYNTNITGSPIAGALYGNGGDLTLNGTFDGGSSNVFAILTGIVKTLYINGNIGETTPVDSIDILSHQGQSLTSLVIGAHKIISVHDQTYQTINNTPIQVSGSTTLTSTQGNISFNNPLVGSDESDLTANAVNGTVSFASTIESLRSLTTTAMNTEISTDVSTCGAQIYNGLVTINGGYTFRGDNVAFNGGINASDYDLTLMGPGIVTLGGIITARDISILGTGVENGIHLLSGNNTWNITEANTGTITGYSNIFGDFTFANIHNLTGGTGNDTFNFQNGGSLTGAVRGGDTTAINTINFADYSTAMHLFLTANNAGNMQDSSGSLLTNFSDINVAVGATSNDNVLQLVNQTNTIHITGTGQGYLNAPYTFSGFNTLQGQSGTDQVVFDVPATITSNNTALVDGTQMTFHNINLLPTPPTPNGPTVNNTVIQAISTTSSTSNNTNSDDSADPLGNAPGSTPSYTLVNTNIDNAIQQQIDLDTEQHDSLSINTSCGA